MGASDGCSAISTRALRRWLCLPAAAGLLDGDPDEEDLEEVVANLREQRDKVCAFQVSQFSNNCPAGSACAFLRPVLELGWGCWHARDYLP